MYTSITTFANKLNEINIAVYSANGTILPFSKSKEQIIKFIEYINLDDLMKCYNDITQIDIDELQLLQEMIGKQSYISQYSELRSGVGNKVITFNYD